MIHVSEREESLFGEDKRCCQAKERTSKELAASFFFSSLRIPFVRVGDNERENTLEEKKKK